jgi:hypothetical protein
MARMQGRLLGSLMLVGLLAGVFVFARGIFCQDENNPREQPVVVTQSEEASKSKPPKSTRKAQVRDGSVKLAGPIFLSNPQDTTDYSR